MLIERMRSPESIFFSLLLLNLTRLGEFAVGKKLAIDLFISMLELSYIIPNLP